MTRMIFIGTDVMLQISIFILSTVLPYLAARPEVIQVDNGRQLFVDDYLISTTEHLTRTVHKPEKYHGNPVLRPETEWENGVLGNKCAGPKSGGLWWDPTDKLYKLWYVAGWNENLALAISKDGIHWTRPSLDVVKGTNLVIPKERFWCDSPTVWLDHNTSDPSQRFKLFNRPPNKIAGSDKSSFFGYALVSRDGIHWEKETKSTNCGDRSSFYYNPFADKWVFSLRHYYGGPRNKDRVRAYRESDDFLSGVKWAKIKKDEKPWISADDQDKPKLKDHVQLYNFDAVAYESIMIGFPMLLWGPSNGACFLKGLPKLSYLAYAYSRDGYHWDRRDREPMIEPSEEEGSWDRGYIQSTGGLFTIVGDKLRIYYSGVRGDISRLEKNDFSNGMYYDLSTGFAELRRDGFVSYDASSTKAGTLTTHPIRFSGKYLFVNVNCPSGSLRAEVLDKEGNVIEGFSADDCKVLSCDSTISLLSWKGRRSLARLVGQAVRLRFILQNGEFYSFWISPSLKGESLGWTAAGGPGLKGGIDRAGRKSYR